MKAQFLLKQNIDTLLRARGQRRHDLAQWCHRTDAWLSQIFREDRRELPQKYLDHVADFFGIATYQLFQPGITPLTERRKADRRSGRDRRLSRAFEAVPPTEAELFQKLRRLTPSERQRIEMSVDLWLETQGMPLGTGPPRDDKEPPTRRRQRTSTDKPG